MTQSRRPSPLQRRVLIVLAALDEKRPGPVLTRDIERVLEQSGKPRSTGQTCAPPAVVWRMPAGCVPCALRTCSWQLTELVELTDARTACGRGTAALLPAGGTSATDLAVELNGITYQACRGDFVVRLDGSTCLQLWNKEGRVVRREGDPLEVAQWLQACHDAGMEVRVQINESAAP